MAKPAIPADASKGSISTPISESMVSSTIITKVIVMALEVALIRVRALAVFCLLTILLVARRISMRAIRNKTRIIRILNADSWIRSICAIY